MVTHWKRHWDALPRQETYYPKNMIRFQVTADKLIDNTRTIFIKLDEKTRRPENAWIGHVYGFKEQDDRIHFKVYIERNIPLENIPRHLLLLKEGWYLELVEEAIPSECALLPPFFHLLLQTRDPETFENLTFWLLKLLGIHTLYKFRKQPGRADGFFILRDLAVIYDCTLNPRFEEIKGQQIENYCAQLKNGRLTYERTSFDISAFRKQVWIITKGVDRIIKRVDNITVREVSVQRLVEIYKSRIIKNINEEELVEELIRV